MALEHGADERDEPVGIVTGASRGLGLALARALAERGWRVVVDARGADDLERAMAGLGGVTAIAGRRLRRSAPAGAGRRSRRRGSICSSTTRGSSGPSPSRRSPTTPSTSSLASTRSTCSRRSRSSNWPSPCSCPGRAMVDITCDAAVEPYEGWGGYGSAKAALEQLTAILAAEHPDLRVYAVDPGDMRTRCTSGPFPARTSATALTRGERARDCSRCSRARCRAAATAPAISWRWTHERPRTPLSSRSDGAAGGPRRRPRRRRPSRLDTPRSRAGPRPFP